MVIATRRSFLGGLAAALAGGRTIAATGLPPVRAITRGPKFHWFGYYDKLQFDPSGRYVLGMEVDFEHRSPRGDDQIRIGMVDTAEGDRWTELGASRSWGWQQGCMLQWVPGSKTEVLWNDREGDRFVCRVFDINSRESRTLPAPIYALSPDGRWAVTTDFRRLNDTRPGYGYAGLPDPNSDRLAPDDAGLWKVNLASGKTELIFSYADAARIPFEVPEGANFSRTPNSLDLAKSKHWFNHLLVSPDGSRFIFLHRWRGPGDGPFMTRMFTMGSDGAKPYVLDPYGLTSHFIWRDPRAVLAWAWHPSHGNAFYLYHDQTQKVEAVGLGVMTVNGHCTYLPGNRWILNDTYPDKERNQNPYLYEVATGRRLPLGHFKSPPEYTGEWRCDLHPRFSPDGRSVCIDSPHGGDGRQLYLIDISGLTG